MQTPNLSEKHFRMNRFTTRSKKSKKQKLIYFLISTVFWTVLWVLLAKAVGNDLLLPSPLAVIKKLMSLASDSEFWITAGMSITRIAAGFLAGAIIGTLLAVLTAFSSPLDAVFSPVGTVIKATPVASFIILALIWIKAANVPSFISFLMVTPIVWSALKTAILNTDIKLLEAAKAYKLGVKKTLSAVYLPSVLPQYRASLITSLGLAWKAGVAAEVLCHPKLSVGNALYESQIYLETTELFAWTATVIILSVIMEKCFAMLIKRVTKGGAK